MRNSICGSQQRMTGQQLQLGMPLKAPDPGAITADNVCSAPAWLCDLHSMWQLLWQQQHLKQQHLRALFYSTYNVPELGAHSPGCNLPTALGPGLCCCCCCCCVCAAWCAGFVASYTNRLKEAVEWSKKAVAVGCFQGSCNSLFTKQPDPWAHSGIANVETCSWEGPFDVMYWACKGLGDTACAQETHQRVYQAKFAREAYGKHMDLYQATKVGGAWGWVCRVGGLRLWACKQQQQRSVQQ